MLTLSKALSASQAATYHQKDFTSETQSYYAEGKELNGEWQGGLAETLGLSGGVSKEEFLALAEGRNPNTNEQMVRSRMVTEYTKADGTVVKSVGHRAGWDATFSAPKSVSLTALVGGDDRVREAHREAVTAALTELERYVHARIGGNNPAESTGRFIVAKFEHDTARPVNGYAAPQLHTHAVIFNVTTKNDGSTRALQEKALFESQSYATAVYQSHLMYRLRDLGYQIERGRSGAPEIRAYSQEYLDASSPRSEQIRDHLERTGKSGPEAAEIAAHATREAKQNVSREEVLRTHREMDAQFGHQAEQAVTAARSRAQIQQRTKPSEALAKEAMTFAKDHLFEREAVYDERAIMTAALRRGMGETTFAAAQNEYQNRLRSGDFHAVASHKYDSGTRITTAEMLAAERDNIRTVLEGRNALAPVMNEREATQYAAKWSHLNDAQRRVMQEVLTSSDRIHGLQGLAGTGKTTTVRSIREGAELKGYKVEGFAPTSRAAAQLRDAGIEANTVQSFLAHTVDPKDTQRRLYVLDESSLASTSQMRAFLRKVDPEDRVLVIGDTRQHQGVEAGRPFQQMQEAGMRTSQLDEIIRQRANPELLAVVQHLAIGKTKEGVEMLTQQGRIVQVGNGSERIAAIARDYVAKPENTVIVSPDNKSRQQINEAVRAELQQAGTLARDEYEFRTLFHRSDLTGAGRTWASLYNPGDVIHYQKGSAVLGIEAESSARVHSNDPKSNTITVEKNNGELVSYDPRRVYGVNVFEERSRSFAVGDRLQFTERNKVLGVSNRDLGTVTEVAPDRMTVKLDGKDSRFVSFDPTSFRQIDHGYATTSHSAQGLTIGRVIVNIDTEQSKTIINDRLAYVAVSRAEHDARIYTNDAATLAERLANDFSKTAAIEVIKPAPEPPPELERRSTKELLKFATSQKFSEAEHRIAAVALDYLSKTDRTVILSSDPAERHEVTRLIRSDLYAAGHLTDGREMETLVVKSIGNRRLAKDYSVGDIVRYGKVGSDDLQLAPESYNRVVNVDTRSNRITVESADGVHHQYNPFEERQLTAYSKVYAPEKMNLALGDRVQITRSDWDAKLVAGSLRTVQSLGDDGSLVVRGDNGKEFRLDAEQARHIAYGYAVDSPKRLLVDRAILSGDEQQIAEQTNAFGKIPDHLQHVSVYTTPSADSLGKYISPAIPSPEVPSLSKIMEPSIAATQELPTPNVEIEGYGISM